MMFQRSVQSIHYKYKKFEAVPLSLTKLAFLGRYCQFVKKIGKEFILCHIEFEDNETLYNIAQF